MEELKFTSPTLKSEGKMWVNIAEKLLFCTLLWAIFFLGRWTAFRQMEKTIKIVREASMATLLEMSKRGDRG
jgi:hypothetical protein